MADLITQPYLTALLADAGLTSGMTTNLPVLAAAASRLIREHCNLNFSRGPVDELYTVDPRDLLVLNQYPVNGCSRVAGNPTAVLSITNASTANQRATVSLATSGDTYTGLVVTGLSLYRVASGVASTDVTVTTAGNPTIQAMANAVNALGVGWSATVNGNYGLRASADLAPCQGARPAIYPNYADFLVHVDDLDFDLDPKLGAIRIKQGSTDPFNSMRFGPYLDTTFGDLSIRGGFNALRVTYDAGWDIVPESVQMAAVECVKAMINGLSRDTGLKGETLGDYSWTGAEILSAIPESARQAIAYYRNHRA